MSPTWCHHETEGGKGASRSRLGTRAHSHVTPCPTQVISLSPPPMMATFHGLHAPGFYTVSCANVSCAMSPGLFSGKRKGYLQMRIELVRLVGLLRKPS